MSPTETRMRRASLTVVLVTATAGLSACDNTGGDTIGTRGGTVVSEDGRFSIDIPEGALDHEVDVVITRTDCSLPHHHRLGACYTVGPRGTAFLYPAEVTYELADMNLGNSQPQQLAVMVERDTGWNPLADRHVDTTDEIVTGSATYLSQFAVVPLGD